MKPLEFGPWEIRISSARANNSKFALVQQLAGAVHLYTVEGRLVRVLPPSIRTDTQPVFSRTSMDYVFTIPTDKPEIWRHNLIDDSAERVAVFPQYERLTAAHAEGDLTPDGWLALAGVDASGIEHIFTYNLHTKQSGEVWKHEGYLDGLKAAYGGWLIASGDRIRAFPVSGMPHLIAEENGHAATGVWQGRPILLWCNAAENPITLYGFEEPDDNFPNAIVMVDIETGEQFGLKSFDWAYAMHVSAGPDFAIISVYDPTTVLPNQIWKAPLDGSPPEKLFEWYGPYNANATPRASYSDNMVLYNRWDGVECKVFGLKMDDEAYIDYSGYVSKREFVIVPQLPCVACGSTIRGILDRSL